MTETASHTTSTVALLENLVGASRASTPQLFEARVRKSPHANFLRYQGRLWTYAQAWDVIGRYASQFMELNRGSAAFRVASFLSNRPEALWAWFGTHAAGGVYVALNRSHRGDLLRDVLKRSGANVLLTESSALDVLPELDECGIEFGILCEDDAAPHSPGFTVLTTAGIEARDRAYAPDPAPSDLATIMFTSGTTGRSKAVRIPHNMLCRGGARVAEALGFRETDVVHLWMPLCHIAGQLHHTMATIAAGGSLALYPTFSASRFWSQVKESSATVFCGLPNILNILSNREPHPDDGKTTLRLGIVGILPPALHSAFEERFGVRLIDSYGMTECEPLTLPAPDAPSPAGSCGKAAPDFEIAIVDDEDIRLPSGKTGEIVVRPRVPDVMMQGYEEDSVATVRLWRNLWWHTGDLGYKDKHEFIFVLGRKKHMIRRRGENISAWELEVTLSKHPAIEECAALGVPSPLGEDDVKTVLKLKQGANFEQDNFIRFCKENMASFMIPRFVEFRQSFPVNDVGKVDKLKLVEFEGEFWDLDPR
ncbi:MAG: AMP-binding protein [Pseudomonadota bacterium]